MFKSSRLASPQRVERSVVQKAANRSDVIDSPSRQKIQLLSDKWNQISNGLEKDKVEKKEVLEERIQELEEMTVAKKPRDEQLMKTLKDQVSRLQDQVSIEKNETDNYLEKREKNLLSIQDTIISSFEQERAIIITNENKQGKIFNEKFISISNNNQRSSKSHDEKVMVRLQDIRAQVQAINSQIENERGSREESAESLQDGIQQEINKFQVQLVVEKKVREETQNKIFGMIESMHNNLQYEIQSERKERENTTEALLKLLEDACVKIDRNFR